MPRRKTRQNALRADRVGLGPAAYFAALLLAQMASAPLCWERGKPVKERQSADTFGILARKRPFDPESQRAVRRGWSRYFLGWKALQPGARSPAPLAAKVLEGWWPVVPTPTFLSRIAPTSAPSTGHRGAGLRSRIEALGGEIRFQCKGRATSRP